MDNMTLIILIVVLGTSIWMFFDAKKIGVRKGLLPGKMFDMGPVGWLVAGLGIWILAFPSYLAMRSAYKQAVADVAAGKQTIHQDVPLAKQMSPGKIITIVLAIILVISAVVWIVMHVVE